MNNHFNVFLLIRSWNSFQYFDNCINSVFQQTDSDYQILFVDDNSDYSPSQKKYIKSKLNNHKVIFNNNRKFALRNAVQVINQYVHSPDDVVVNLDSDDWLLDKNAISIIRETYSRHNCDFTYGDCQEFINGRLSINSSKALFPTNHRYPEQVEKNNLYRLEHFRPNHLRTWKAGIFKSINESAFKDRNGQWIKFNEDLAIFFPLLELSKGNYKVIDKSLYAYNCSNPLNDKKINLKQKLEEEIYLRSQRPYGT
ncbi:MAG: glycosyltransferase [Patescibacteria group bacterium]